MFGSSQMTDSTPPSPRPTLADLQEQHRAIEARVAELEADETQQEFVELLRALITDTAALLVDIEPIDIEQHAVPATPTSSHREIGDDDAELQSVVGRLRGVLESIAEVRPAQLFARMDQKVGQLDQFQRDLQPVKTKIDELVQVVGGRHGYRDVVDGFERLDQRIKILTGLVVVLAVVAVIAIFV